MNLQSLVILCIMCHYLIVLSASNAVDQQSSSNSINDKFNGSFACERRSILYFFSQISETMRQHFVFSPTEGMGEAPKFENADVDVHCVQSAGNGTKLRKSGGEQATVPPLLQFAFDTLMIMLIGVISVATVVHWRQGGMSNSFWVQLLVSFSALRNVKRLVQMPKDMQQDTITCLFGLRFLAMAWTLVGHSFIFIQHFLANPDEFSNGISDNFWNQWISNFTLSVDVFFVMSGTLTAYTWFRRVEQQRTEERAARRMGVVGWATDAVPRWLRFYRHRLIRLWPAYVFTLFAINTRVGFTHYHRDLPPTDVAAQCRQHWVEHVLFINSLTDSPCLFWTWYLGTEFIFFLLSPIFLTVLRRSVVHGLSLIGLATAGSALANMVTMHQHNFPPQHMFWRQPAIFCPDFLKYHYMIYIKPWYRIGPYLIGIVLGYVLAMRSVSAPRFPALRGSFICIGWATACCAVCWAVFGLYPALQAWDWPLYHLFYGGFARIVFALAIAWLIFACHCGNGGHINWVLSLRPLLPLSVLSYSAYLFHMIPVVFTYKHSPSSPLQYNSKLNVFVHCALQLAISYAFALVCALLAELPALNIEAILLDSKMRQTNAQ